MHASRLVVLLAGALALAGSAPAAAQSSQLSDAVPPSPGLKGEFYFGPHIGYSFIGDHNFRCKCDVMQEHYLIWGGRIGYMVTDNLGVETTGQYLNLHPSFWELTGGALWDSPVSSQNEGTSRPRSTAGIRTSRRARAPRARRSSRGKARSSRTSRAEPSTASTRTSDCASS